MAGEGTGGIPLRRHTSYDKQQSSQVSQWDNTSKPVVHEVSPTKNKPQVHQSKKDFTLNPKEIVLRRSVFFLITMILGIEIFFDFCYGLLRVSSMFISFTPLQTYINQTILGIFLFLNILKIWFMLIAALQWVSSSYEITKAEIRYKSGILHKYQKVFLCTNTQEVTYDQGILGRVFNYGTIEVYNAALKEQITLTAIPNPIKYMEIIKNSVFEKTSHVSYINTQ